MDNETETYDAVNKAWKQTCRILLGDDVGELKEYKKYLQKVGADPPIQKKSAISGKEVNIFANNICPGAKFIAGNEAQEYEKRLRKTKFNMNDLQDIDSLLRALGELCYAGNITLGNSGNIVRSNKITNSFYVYESTFLNDCKYIGFCSNLRESEYAFGTTGSKQKFCIRNVDTAKATRCMEVWAVSISNSDCYYCANLEGCTDLMFCFSQKNKHYMIGNNQLSREEYSSLKKKLIEDIRETLREKKNLPSLKDIMTGEYDV